MSMDTISDNTSGGRARCAVGECAMQTPLVCATFGTTRREFEAWFEADAMPSEADWFRREDDNPDEYYHGVTHTAWRAWQESRRIAFAECESDARAMMIMADEAAARIRTLGETR